MTVYIHGELPLLQNEAAQKILYELAAKHHVPIEILKELIGAEQQHVGSTRRKGLYVDFDTILDGLDNMKEGA